MIDLAAIYCGAFLTGMPLLLWFTGQLHIIEVENIKWYVNIYAAII